MIYGHIVCHNEWPDILRAIESLFVFCDKILICYGGKPDTEMRKFLEDRRDIYHLEIYDNPFKTVLEQRQLLLDHTPRNSWVACLDPDEKYSLLIMYGIRKYLSRIDPAIYTDPKRKVPIVVPICCHNLTGDILHYDGDGVYHYMKFFYFDKDLEWYAADSGDFHAHIAYKSQKDKGVNYLLTPINGFAILHYARLCPDRLRWRRSKKGNPKFGYTEGAWEEEILARVGLPEECQ